MKKIENISNKDCILTLPRNWNDENMRKSKNDDFVIADKEGIK